MIKNLTKKEIILSIISIPILTFFWYFLFTLFGYASVILSVVLSLYSIYEVLRTRALIKEIR